MDDRRIIPGILHMLRTGARWRDCPVEFGPYTTVYNRFNRWSKQGVWEDVFCALSGSSGVIHTTSVDSTHVKAHRSAAGAKRGDYEQALGRSHGGRTTKIHAITDDVGRPLAFTLTPGGPRSGWRRGTATAHPAPKAPARDRAYDARKLRDWLAERGCEAVIPPNPTRKHPRDHIAYRNCNVVECMF